MIYGVISSQKNSYATKLQTTYNNSIDTELLQGLWILCIDIIHAFYTMDLG